MKILIASDSFKDSLSSIEVGQNLKKGLLSVKKLDVDILPVSDGGEGSVDSIISYLNGEKIEVIAKDPLMRNIGTYYVVVGSMAVIEMAKTSGLQLLKINKRNPMNTSTFGVGQLIKDALDKGYREFLINIGGSATCDGGIGMASALGYKFIDKNSDELLPVGSSLPKIFKINKDKVDKRIFESSFTVACDVDNPLFGKNGASYVYSKQKGANEDEIEYLDSGLRNLSNVIERFLDIDISHIKGSGAAGGLGGGLVAFLKAKLVSGVETILQLLNFDDRVKSCDLVITGEGKVDNQTLNGKVVSGVLKHAKLYNKKVIIVSGYVDDSALILYEHGADLILGIQDKPMSVDLSIKNTKNLLINTGIKIAKIIKLFA
jgi:glycerate kinase